MANQKSDRKIILQVQIGGANDDAHSYRRASSTLLSKGWVGFVNDYVIPKLTTWNVRRVMFNRVFGQVKYNWPGNPLMEFDMYQQALAGNCWNDEAGDPVTPAEDISVLTDDFGQAMAALRPYVDEVICYIGAPRYFRTDLQPDPSDGYSGGNWTAWLEAALACVQPFLDAGCSIGMDATGYAHKANETIAYYYPPAAQIPKCGARQSEYSTLFIRHLENLGTRVYGEPTPQKHDYIDTGLDGHLDDVPRVITDPTMWNAIQEHAQWMPPADFRPLCDEVVRWQLFTGMDVSEYEPYLQSVLAAGYSALIAANYIGIEGAFSPDLKREYATSAVELSLSARGSVQFESPVRGSIELTGPARGSIELTGTARDSLNFQLTDLTDAG